jgi:hypothetical protein
MTCIPHDQWKASVPSAGAAHALLKHVRMRKLEARYHPPLAASGTYIVVGHVVTDASESRMARIEAAPSLARYRSPAAILATLKHLVATTAPRSFERLEALRSRYWSFVPVTEEPSRPLDVETPLE